jgi:hypothetical protein
MIQKSCCVAARGTSTRRIVVVPTASTSSPASSATSSGFVLFWFPREDSLLYTLPLFSFPFFFNPPPKAENLFFQKRQKVNYYILVNQVEQLKA